MKLYETFELEFAGEKLTENWASADVTAVFTNGDTQVTTKGFYAGDGIYKVRFLPERTGRGELRADDGRSRGRGGRCRVQSGGV